MSAPLAITLGDPCGIGPEVALRALSAPDAPADVLLFGSSSALLQADAQLAQSDPGWRPRTARIKPVPSLERALALDARSLRVIDPSPDLSWAPARPDADAARSQLAALRGAIEAARAGQARAIVTAPWTKSIFRLARLPCVGHTEVLAHAFDAPDHVMMLAGDRLRVALATVHIPLAEVADKLDVGTLSATLVTCARELTALFGIERPRIAVCGLNPHAGEGGVMGDEEARVIAPAIEAARRAVARAEFVGPLPADTLFVGFRDAQPYDAIACMYHDQGLIPLKLIHFGASANITLGLPIVRTSPDHGTAYDIAGRARARDDSMRYAIGMARALTAP